MLKRLLPITLSCALVLMAFFAGSSSAMAAKAARSIATSSSISTSTKTQLLDRHWEFALIDNPDQPVPEAHSKAWRMVDLPHDWSIEGEFDSINAMGNDGGYLPDGVGIYRKVLNLDKDFKNREYGILFEGVYMDSEVKVNGKKVGGHPYGYSSFSVDITPALNPEGEDVLEVVVDNSQQRSGRWYTGSGIYRHVWLKDLPKTHFDLWGVYVTTPKVSKDNADVKVEVTVCNNDSENVSSTLEVDLLYNGQVVSSASVPVTIKAGEITTSSINLNVKNPHLWSPSDPNLYQADVRLVSDAGNESAIAIMDQAQEIFGIRSIEYSAKEGFKLNGEKVILNGGCAHHDNGVIGARAYDASEARKVRELKEAGFNAVRTSHNPPSPEFLRQCDIQGLMVIDEAFDGWRQSKTNHDYSVYFDEWYPVDIEYFIKRDRNHPSIIAWSIGNEVIERKQIEIVTTARHLANRIREFDRTRPITSALAAWDSDWEIYDPLAEVHDIVGYNYMIHMAESDHQRDPNRVMWQTESYPRDAFNNWKMVRDHEYVIGDFVWTAIDYLGESGIGRHYYTGDPDGEHWYHPQWPWHGAYCGDIDLTGYRKPISYYRDMLYNPETAQKIYMAVREPNGYYGEIQQTMWGTYPTWVSWNWPGHEGKDIEVEVISTLPVVRLYLNGQQVGQKPVNEETQFKAIFTLAYEEGELKAVGIDSKGNETDEVSIIKTASAPHAIRLKADRDKYTSGIQDIAFVEIEVLDKNGVVMPIADNIVKIEVSPKGELIGTCSADFKDNVSYSSPERKMFRGRGVAAVKVGDSKGKINVKATAPGLKTANLTLMAE